MQLHLPQLLKLGHFVQRRGLLKLDALTGIALGGAMRLLRGLQVRGQLLQLLAGLGLLLFALAQEGRMADALLVQPCAPGVLLSPFIGLASFTGDGAYDTLPVYEAVLRRGAIAILPPRKRDRIRKGAAFTYRNEAVAACRRLGRTIWKAWSGYHRRSLVETKMHCIKRLGERVMSRTFERQVNELHIRAAILNRFTELGRPQTVAVA